MKIGSSIDLTKGKKRKDHDFDSEDDDHDKMMTMIMIMRIWMTMMSGIDLTNVKQKLCIIVHRQCHNPDIGDGIKMGTINPNRIDNNTVMIFGNLFMLVYFFGNNNNVDVDAV